MQLNNQSFSVMTDKRKTNGGKRVGAGRKPKADEQQLIEKLTPLDDIAFNALKIGLEKNQNWAVRLFFEYKFGKAKEFREVEITEKRRIGYGSTD